MADNGIRLVDETQLTDDQKVYLRQFFYDRLNGLVNPIGLNEIDTSDALRTTASTCWWSARKLATTA